MKAFRLALLALISPFALCAGSLTWKTDLELARTEAAETGKPIMVLFTGSDWCSWCIRLENEVLSKEEFSDQVADKFVFVMIDKPRRKPLAAEQAAKNAALFAEYAVASVPTVMMLSPEGEQLGSTGFREGGAAAFAEHLLGMSPRSE